MVSFSYITISIFAQRGFCYLPVVVIVLVSFTTYALILPAITLEEEVAEDTPGIYVDGQMVSDDSGDILIDDVFYDDADPDLQMMDVGDGFDLEDPLGDISDDYSFEFSLWIRNSNIRMKRTTRKMFLTTAWMNMLPFWMGLLTVLFMIPLLVRKALMIR